MTEESGKVGKLQAFLDRFGGKTDSVTHPPEAATPLASTESLASPGLTVVETTTESQTVPPVTTKAGGLNDPNQIAARRESLLFGKSYTPPVDKVESSIHPTSEPTPVEKPLGGIENISQTKGHLVFRQNTDTTAIAEFTGTKLGQPVVDSLKLVPTDVISTGAILTPTDREMVNQVLLSAEDIIGQVSNQAAYTYTSEAYDYNFGSPETNTTTTALGVIERAVNSHPTALNIPLEGWKNRASTDKSQWNKANVTVLRAAVTMADGENGYLCFDRRVVTARGEKGTPAISSVTGEENMVVPLESRQQIQLRILSKDEVSALIREADNPANIRFPFVQAEKPQ